jgi:hypothetical protein
MTRSVSGRCSSHLYWFTVLLLILSGLGCASTRTLADDVTVGSRSPASLPDAKPITAIPVAPGGPADTVRAFYKYLREKRFREAVFLTNLRPAVEGLTESELKEFSLDFETIAGRVPAEIEINGEIVSGDHATVTANLPAEDEDKNEIQTIRLRNQSGVWVILTVEPNEERRMQKDGKNYLNNLRIETHEQEARGMLDRISKAELAYSLQHGGDFADIPVLIEAGLLPDDARGSTSTGYNYSIQLSSQNKRYTAAAIPAVYGKTGRLSFLLRLDEKGVARAMSKDVAGKPLLP